MKILKRAVILLGLISAFMVSQPQAQGLTCTETTAASNSLTQSGYKLILTGFVADRAMMLHWFNPSTKSLIITVILSENPNVACILAITENNTLGSAELMEILRGGQI